MYQLLGAGVGVNPMAGSNHKTVVTVAFVHGWVDYFPALLSFVVDN